MNYRIGLTIPMITALWSATLGTLPAEHPGHAAIKALQTDQFLGGDGAKRWATFAVKRLKELRSRLSGEPVRDSDLLRAEEALICMTSQILLDERGETRDMIHALLELPCHLDSTYEEDRKSAYEVGFIPNAPEARPRDDDREDSEEDA